MSAYIGEIIAWPLIKVFPDRYWGQYDPHAGYVRTKRVPKALKKGRLRRRLSTESIRNASLSPLLQIPREVRDAIWKFVVGKMQVHWCTENRRLKGYRCRSSEKFCQQQCLSWHGQPNFGVMNALLSCRQIYSESIDFLYSCNTFDTSDADVIAFLPRILLPYRINKIRNVQILLSISLPPSYLSTHGRPGVLPLQQPEKMRQCNHYHQELWNDFWKTLSEMKGLEILRVELTMHGRHDHLWNAEEFDCLQWLHRPRDIHLLLPDAVARRLTGKIGMANCAVKSSIADDVD